VDPGPGLAEDVELAVDDLPHLRIGLDLASVRNRGRAEPGELGRVLVRIRIERAEVFRRRELVARAVEVLLEAGAALDRSMLGEVRNRVVPLENEPGLRGLGERKA